METISKSDARALVHTHVPPAVKAELRQVAQANHRSMAGEVRRAIAEHLERERPAERSAE
jgi:predicted transcriptional regulator